MLLTDGVLTNGVHLAALAGIARPAAMSRSAVDVAVFKAKRRARLSAAALMTVFSQIRRSACALAS
jgi:hypothetical protein